MNKIHVPGWPMHIIAIALFITVTAACTHSIGVPGPVWNYIYAVEQYREVAIEVVKLYEAANPHPISPTSTASNKLTQEEYNKARLRYADARAKWNAWIDNLETIALNNAKIEDWPKQEASALDAFQTAEAFVAPIIKEAYATPDTVHVKGIADDVLKAIFGSLFSTSTFGALISPTYDQVVGILKQLNEGKIVQRNLLVQEVDRRKWPTWECAVKPTDPGCALRAPRQLPGPSPVTPTTGVTPTKPVTGTSQ